MWNFLHLGNYSTCRCASHKKHHEVKGKHLAGAFQSSSMALTDLDTRACTFRCFSLHTPERSTSHKAHYPTTTLKLWRVATSGVFPVLFLATTSSLRLLCMSLLASGQGCKAGVEKMLIGMFAMFMGTFALKGLVGFGALVFAPSLQFCFRTSTLSLNSMNS